MDAKQRKAMQELMAMTFTPGKGMTVSEVKVDVSFPARLVGMTQKQLLEALEDSINARENKTLGKLGGPHAVPILEAIEKLKKEKVETTPPPIKVKMVKGLPCVSTLNRKTLAEESKVVYTGGMKKLNRKNIVTQILCGSVSVTKASQSHEARLSPIADVPKKVEKLVPNLQRVAPIVRGMFKAVEGMEDLINQVSECLDDEGVLKRFSEISNGVVPKKFQDTITDVGTQRLSNSVLTDLNDKHLRARDKILKTVPCADKSGIGYYNIMHYDGVPVRGYQRKVMEFVNDFDFKVECPVVRVDVTENSAFALFNAIREQKRKVLVLYASKTGVGKIADHFKEGEVVRSGCLKCTDSMFRSLFKDHMEKVYYYQTASPQGSTKFSVLNLLSNNRKMDLISKDFNQFGYYSFYADTQSLLTDTELELVRKLKTNPKLTVKNRGFSPSCMVRKGLFRVTKGGAMNMSDVFRNCAAGKLHYITWCFKNYPFSSNLHPGDKYVQSTENLFSLEHEDEATREANEILRSIMQNASGALQARVADVFDLPPAVTENEEDREGEEQVEQDEEEDEFMFGDGGDVIETEAD